MDKSEIRNAATVIVLRDRQSDPKVLMGQRGSKAAFMPNKFVFPGGAVDAADADVPLATTLPNICRARLAHDSALPPEQLAAAAIRELWEETGQVLGKSGAWGFDAPRGWRGFAATHHVPDFSGLNFVFRAVTPPGKPRRFDARFFLVDAERLASDPDDFSGAEDELSHLQWVRLNEARNFNLPFITTVVLAEIAANLDAPGAPETVPYFQHHDERHFLNALGGASPLDAIG